jgi:hypothetical protein
MCPWVGREIYQCGGEEHCQCRHVSLRGEDRTLQAGIDMVAIVLFFYWEYHGVQVFLMFDSA